jgi:hypothetical protein
MRLRTRARGGEHGPATQPVFRQALPRHVHGCAIQFWQPSNVTATQLIATLAAGSALLAVWCYTRWPGAAPKTLGRALVLGLVAFAFLQVALIGMDLTVDTSQRVAVLALLGLVVPALTYTFLASLWVLRLLANTLKGG